MADSRLITAYHKQPPAEPQPSLDLIHLPMPSKSPAQTLLEKADKKASSSSGWFSSSTKFEEAGDLYQQAANSFKLEKLFREAGDAFSKEAECREKCKETNDAANAWWNAAKAYKRGFPDRASINYSCLIFTEDFLHPVAVQALSQTVTHLTQAGRFRQAADREKEIAQIYLQEQHDLRRACESFERAGDWYAQEDAAAWVMHFGDVYGTVYEREYVTVPRMPASKMQQTSMPSWRSIRLRWLAMTKLRVTPSVRP
jgi:hypothetical protein